ncbi:diaminopimelate epimerase [Actinocatenispora thailandica]|uniref:Diaminopimelate epimerase n=1 Tax=Actinocatenispora thailandica TaxID=227318 RepID=A0A7R7DRT6_9ACTN|nr:diaminopimelate epimerase [Actinocatenispora thailandica]BCJ36609.1 diaminopimelate epimerase [Actinocatenispora thailandica]
MGTTLAGAAFAKGHGTENDFVILPDPDGALPLTAERVAALCDRRAGLGADGVLRVVRSAKHPDAAGYAEAAEWFMDYWNADGSIAEMCGNGIRVFLRYLAETGLVDATAGAEITIATRSGLRTGRLGETIAVQMGTPTLVGTTGAQLGGVGYPGVAADAGNPHLVCPVPAAELAGLDLTAPPAIDPAVFPRGANVEFVADLDDPVPGADRHVAMRVYERGAGETRSCGSGVCAVAAVVLAEAGETAGTVAVDVPGGRLTATVEGDSLVLAGPAVIVATGTLA